MFKLKENKLQASVKRYDGSADRKKRNINLRKEKESKPLQDYDHRQQGQKYVDDINLLPLCWFEADRQILLPFSHRRVSEVDAEVGGGVDSQSASLMYHRVAGVETRLFLDLALCQEALC